jgi:phosphatidylglycerophosphate synthase
MVAIASGTASPVGELYNEIPDRVSDAATFIGLGYAAHAHPTLGYLAACTAVFVAYVRAIGKASGAHQEFCGPFAKPQRMFLVTLTGLWCALTPLAWQSFPAFGVPAAILGIVVLGTALTALRRLRRIAAALHGSS